MYDPTSDGKAQDKELQSIQTSIASYLKDLNLLLETIKANKMVTLNSINNNTDRICARLLTSLVK